MRFNDEKKRHVFTHEKYNIFSSLNCSLIRAQIQIKLHIFLRGVTICP